MIATGDATKAGLEHCGAARLTAELAKTRSLTVADCSRRVRRDELWSSLTSKALTTMANAIDLQVHRHRRSGRGNPCRRSSLSSAPRPCHGPGREQPQLNTNKYFIAVNIQCPATTVFLTY